MLRLLILLFTLSYLPLAQAASPAELLKLLQEGGYVVYMRHAATDSSQEDQTELKLEDCATQRNLSEKGREQAKYIGETWRKLGITPGKVFSSPFCRCMQTAELAFGRAEEQKLLYFTVGATKSERIFQSFQLRQMLATAPEGKSNTVIVSHTANLKEAADVWPKPEGVMHVFKPLDQVKGLFEHLGAVTPDDWKSLAAP